MMNKIYKIGDVINDWVLIEKSNKTYANGNIIYKAVHNKTGKIALGTPYLFRTNKVSSGAVRKGKHDGETVNGWLLEDTGKRYGKGYIRQYKGTNKISGKVVYGPYDCFKNGNLKETNKALYDGCIVNGWLLEDTGKKTNINQHIYKGIEKDTGRIAYGISTNFKNNTFNKVKKKNKHHGEIVNGWLLEDIGLKVGNSRNTKYKGIHQETGKVGFGAYREFKLGNVSNKVKVKEQPKKKKINVSDTVDIKQTLEAQLKKIANVAKAKGYTITYTIE